MYLEQQKNLATHVRAFLREKYHLDLPNIVIDQPPKVEMGEFALPLVVRAGKAAAQSSAQDCRRDRRRDAPARGIREARSRRRRLHQRAAEARRCRASAGERARQSAPPSHAGEGAANVSGKILVEHTSINPNKAAHIGHLRNAILGDTFVRLLRAAGHTVDIQNYIDNTGVQVADVVVGFIATGEQIEAGDCRTDRRHADASIITAGTSTRASRSGTSRTKST